MNGRVIKAAIGAVAVLLLSAPGAMASGSDSWTQWAASPQDAWIRSLDFTAASTLVASSDGDGIFQSAATAGPWTQTNTGLDNPGDKAVFQVVASGGTFYAATSGGLFTAPQSPSPSWTQLSPGPGNNTLDMGGIQSVVVESPSALVVAVAGAAGPGVYTSADSGGTWHRAGGMPTGENIFYLAKGAGPVVYAAGDSGVWTSVDGGASWTLTSDGINTASTTFRVAVGPAPNEVWAATGSDVYQSIDGGLTWLNVDGSGPTALPAAQVKKAFLLAPSLQTADVLIGTDQGVWASNDGGLNWGQMSPDASGPGGGGVFGNRIIWALGVGFTPPAILAGTQGFGVYSLPVAAAAAPATLGVSPSSGLNPGDTISVSPAWTGSLPIFYTYQWKRCPNNTNCTDVAGATDASYVIPDGDANSTTTYQVTVCATNLLTPAPVCKTSSKTSGGVAPRAGTEPVPYQGVNKTPSSISPDPHQSYPWGTTFTINPGDWGTEATPGTKITPTVFSYQWQRCDQSSTCTVIPGATNSSYTTTPDDVGDTIRGYVKVDSFFGSTPSQFYEADETFTIIEKTPVNTALPKVIGAPVVGTTLQSTAGAWDAHTPVYSRRWLRCGADGLDCQPVQPDQTGHSYTLTSADLGSRLEVEITATQHDPSQDRVTVADSPPSGVVVNPVGPPPPPPPPSKPPKAPVIKIGTPHKLILGARLTGPSKETGFVKLSYQWLRNGKPIKHATGRTYKLTRKDLGQRISLRLTLRTSTGKRIVVTSKALRIPKPKPKHRKKHR